MLRGAWLKAQGDNLQEHARRVSGVLEEFGSRLRAQNAGYKTA